MKKAFVPLILIVLAVCHRTGSADGTIYARTSRSRDGKDRWLVMGLKGDVSGAAEFPRVDDAPFLATLNGVNYHTVHNGHLYAIRNNERTDDWELFVARIK